MYRNTLTKTFISLLLVLATLINLVSPVFGEEEVIYIKEIVTSTGETESEAKSWLTKNGYIVLNENLNAGTGEDPVYLGYKTTTKKEEAITSISLMNMNGGYELMDYTSFAEKNQANIASMTSRLRTACQELKSKLTSGSEAAQTALDYLNIFTVPEAKQSLGDYLIDSARTNADYRMILLVCNTLITQIIYTQLSLGTSDYDQDTWVHRMAQAGVDDTLRGDDYEEYWQEQFDFYYADALELYHVLAAFREKYLAAEKRKIENNGEVFQLDMPEEEARDAIESFAKTGEASDESTDDAFIYSILAYLNQFSFTSDLPTVEDDYSIIRVKEEYRDHIIFDGENAYYITHSPGAYGEETTKDLIPFDFFISYYAEVETNYNYRLHTASTTLGDVLLEIAGMNEEDEEAISLLYPMVRALTPAQRSLLVTDGFLTYMKLSILDEAALETLNQDLPTYKERLLTALGSDTASVWMGTNRDIYSQKIALTSEAKRDAAAANDYEKITYVSEFDTDIKVALCYIGGAAAAVSGVTLIALGIGGIVFHGAGAAIVCGLMTMGGAISATISGVAFGCVGVIGLAVSAVVIAALIVCAIIYAVDCLIDLFNYYNPDYTSIPSIIIDSTKNGYVTYHAVKERGTKNSDINIWEAKRWNALYTTTDESAGAPLTVNQKGQGFQVVYGSTKTPENATPVTLFGSERVANLNADDYDDDVNGIYLYFFRSEQEEATTEDGIYLESMILLCNESERAVRDLIQIKGYELLDFNLTSDTDYATFIGFTTTTNPNNAITDIRVSYAGSEAKIYYGDVSDTYGLAGSTSKTTEGDATDLFISLYYTKSKNRGTPIKASLFVSKNATTPIGYEPVNLFCGGNAFDFNIYPEEDPSDWKNHAYVFFEPSVSYTAENSELYLGGIVFVSGSTDMDAGKLDSYVKEMGMTLVNNNLTAGFYEDEDRTWLTYSTTYNPYRAIYDIGVYTAEYKSQTLPENLVLDGVGYMACQTYTQGDRTYYGNTFWGGHYRLLRPTHAYISNSEDYGGDDEYGDTLVCNRGMYVCGPESGKNPIRIASLTFSRSSQIPEGHIAVHDMTDKYATTALNLALYDNEYKNSLYITYEGTAPVKQKYISAITVVTSKAEDYSYDKTMYKLMASGGDEIIKINLAETSEDSWRNSSFAAGFDEDSDGDDYEDSVAYIRITRTKVKMDAIGSIVIVQSSQKPSDTLLLPYDLTENTVSYTLAGDGISYCEGTKYYFYYSTVGNKISEFTIDHKPIVSGKTTIVTNQRKLLTDIGFYYHTYSDVSLPYYSLVSIATGNTELDAIKTLLSQGCTEVVRINQSGKPVLLGFARTSSAVKGIKNVILSQSTESSLTIGGYTYTKTATARGFSVYQTTEGLKTKAITYITGGTDTPVSSSYPKGTVFEYVQNESGEKSNFASVASSSTPLYMYINHKDNASFSDQAFFASVFTWNDSITYILVLFGLCLLGVGATLCIKKSKKEGVKKRK